MFYVHIVQSGYDDKFRCQRRVNSKKCRIDKVKQLSEALQLLSSPPPIRLLSNMTCPAWIHEFKAMDNP